MLYFPQMSSITISLPDDLALQIRARQQQLPRILELGLMPTPEQILNLLPSPRLSARVAEMIEKSRTGAG